MVCKLNCGTCESRLCGVFWRSYLGVLWILIGDPIFFSSFECVFLEWKFDPSQLVLDFAQVASKERRSISLLVTMLSA
jgi:hypothetical protein